jgi:hypothetical protein
MTDRPDLATIIAEIICDGLSRSAKEFHKRRVVFVDDERELLASIRKSVERLCVHAKPDEQRGFSFVPKHGVGAVIQRTLLGDER